MKIDDECRIEGTSIRIIVENEEQVELSFTRLWDPSLQGKHAPLNIDKRFFLNLVYNSVFYMICIFNSDVWMIST